VTVKRKMPNANLVNKEELIIVHFVMGRCEIQNRKSYITNRLFLS